MKDETVRTGYVATFRDDKGYGFIIPDHHHEENSVFVHYSQIVRSSPEHRRTLVKGNRVSYQLGPNARNGKPQAINVHKLVAVGE